MKTIIMAGGRGTRIRPVAGHIPKPMIEIGGKPVLEHEIECLREQGFRDILLTVSHLSSVIMDYFGDGSKISPATGRPFGVEIEYYIEETPLGNAGALFKLWKSGKLGGLEENGNTVYPSQQPFLRQRADYFRQRGQSGPLADERRCQTTVL